MKTTVKKIVITTLLACFVSVASVASAAGTYGMPGDWRQIKHTQAKLARLKDAKARELSRGHRRAAARIQIQIDATRAELRAEKRAARHGM